MEKENDKAPEGEKSDNQIEEIKPLSEQDFIKNDDPKQIISDLTNKIILLEKANNDLKAKNENLVKNNFKNKSLGLKSSLIGMKLGLASQILMKKANSDSSKLADMIKEKEDLQEINEKMLDLLTEKELENEDLIEKLKNNELNSKIEIEQNLEKINTLKEKIKSLENYKESTVKEIDDIVEEYTSFQEKLKSHIEELTLKEKELLSENNLKETQIQKLSAEINELEIQNRQLKKHSEKMEEINENEQAEQEELISQNIKMKKNNEYLTDKIKSLEQNLEKINKSKEEGILNIEKKLEEEKINFKTYKDNKTKEFMELKNQMNKNNLDIKFLSEKIKQKQNLFEQEKEKNFSIQTNLDKKIKEIKEVTEYSKKLLANKDSIISQYEEKISEMNKEKNELISQNKELIDKLKSKNDVLTANKTLENILDEEKENENKKNLDFYIQENKLLNDEINNLKEQLMIKGKDFSNIKNINDENIKLKLKNEELLNENENIKNKLEEYQKKEVKNKLLSIKNKLTESIKVKLRSDNIKEKANYEKQIEALKKLKQEEKNYYENQIKNITMELMFVKLKNTKQKTVNNIVGKINGNMKINYFKNNEEENKSSIEQNFLFILSIVIAFTILFLIDTNF